MDIDVKGVSIVTQDRPVGMGISVEISSGDGRPQ